MPMNPITNSLAKKKSAIVGIFRVSSDFKQFHGQASFSSRELCSVDLNIKSPHDELGS
jgi:hypothetical protein